MSIKTPYIVNNNKIYKETPHEKHRENTVIMFLVDRDLQRLMLF